MDPKNPKDVKKFADIYKKNKGVDPTSMIIYGLLANQKMGGYDLYKILQVKKDALGPIIKANKTAVYNALKKMQENGEAEVVDILKDTNRPPKSIYTLTDKGRDKLKEMIREDLRRPPVIYFNVAGSLGLAQDLPPAELRTAVEKKIGELEFLVSMQEVYGNMSAGPLLKVLGKAKLDLYKALLGSMKETLDVIDNNPHESLFQWPDIKKSKIWKTFTEEEER